MTLAEFAEHFEQAGLAVGLRVERTVQRRRMIWTMSSPRALDGLDGSDLPGCCGRRHGLSGICRLPISYAGFAPCDARGVAIRHGGPASDAGCWSGLWWCRGGRGFWIPACAGNDELVLGSRWRCRCAQRSAGGTAGGSDAHSFGPSYRRTRYQISLRGVGACGRGVAWSRRVVPRRAWVLVPGLRRNDGISWGSRGGVGDQRSGQHGRRIGTHSFPSYQRRPVPSQRLMGRRTRGCLSGRVVLRRAWFRSRPAPE